VNARQIVRVAIHGVGGRMGRSIIDVLEGDEIIGITGALEHEGSALIGADLGAITRGEPNGIAITSDLEAGLEGADVVIDFTRPDPTATLLGACAHHGVAAVVGTTGLHDAALSALDEAAKRVPVVFAPNMSVGVNVLFYLAARAAEMMGPEFDAEIVEMHHRKKVDAPSGTAVRLAEVVAEAKGFDPQKEVIHGRSGEVGRRPDREIGVMTLRGGDVVGEHTLYLAGAGERIELTHRATDRAIFARGAVRAAKWLAGKPAGRYDMADVLGVPR
jgi:4-hydroxy-tetrahydrodipicolinate reductase